MLSTVPVSGTKRFSISVKIIKIFSVILANIPSITNVRSLTQDEGSSYTRSRIDTVVSKIEALKDDYARLKTTRNSESKSLERSKEDCKKAINAFRKELDNLLDSLEKCMLKLLDSHEDEEQKRIDQHISTLTAILEILEADHKLLQDAKNQDGNTFMFTADIQVSKCLQDYNDRLSDIDNDAINTLINFEKNAKLAKLLTEIDSLGSLNRCSASKLKSGRKIMLDSKIQSQTQVNVKLPNDRKMPCITGTVVMSAGASVFCDFDNI